MPLQMKQILLYVGKLTLIHDYFFDSIDNILDFINKLEKNIFFVGNCGEFLLNMIEFRKNKAWEIYEVNSNNNISAMDIGKCAFDKFNAGNYGDSDFLTPLYLKKSSAESKGTN